MSLACLVLPKDLLNLIRLQPQDFGWLSGTMSKKDLVYFVFKLKQSGHEVRSLYDFVWRHARLINSAEQVPWYKAKAGFGRQLDQGSITDIAKLREWLRSPAEVQASKGVQMALFVEPDGNACSALLVNDGSGPFSIVRESLSILELHSDYSKLLDGLVPVHELAAKKVVIVGVGSGGGNVAVQLAAAGVGHLSLFDPDRLEPDNVFRHVCGLEYVGCYKVDAVKELIESYGLKAKVDALREDILQETAAFFEKVKVADLVVCASDTKQSRALVNFAAVSLQKPSVSVCTYDGATVGEVLVYQHGLPCLECVRSALRQAGALETENSDTPIPDAVSYQTETVKQPHSRGTRVDVTLVASLASKVSLLVLTTGKKLMSHLPASYLVWGGVKNNTRAAPFSFDLPMSLRYVPVPRHENCPVCGDHMKELEKKHEERLSRIFLPQS